MSAVKNETEENNDTIILADIVIRSSVAVFFFS